MRRVAVFGVGGVGGHRRRLARAGVGHITVIDDDVVSVSNINRQAVAMDSTVGRPKVEVIAEQVRDINPACEVTPLRLFYTPENAETLDLARFDAIADCIDTVKAKVTLICRAKEADVYAISAMGAGNKLDPTRFGGGGYRQNQRLPALPRDAHPAQKARRGAPHGRLLHRGAAGRSSRTSKTAAMRRKRQLCAAVVGLIMAGEIIKPSQGGTLDGER
ncbi:MAG: ThiF family adenylyltransferase [Christensenellales bacterium]